MVHSLTSGASGKRVLDNQTRVDGELRTHNAAKLQHSELHFSEHSSVLVRLRDIVTRPSEQQTITSQPEKS